jgi:phosphopantothenoylcysteine synthetase/decarboxylase
MNKVEGPTSKKTKEPRKRVNHKGEQQVPEPLPFVRSISNKERGKTS